MYSSFGNHLNNFGHYIIGFIIIFCIYPSLIFEKNQDSTLENIVSNYIRMVFLTIVCGYILVLLRIFEFLGLIFAFIIIYIAKYFLSNRRGAFGEKISKINAYLLDASDGIVSIKKDLVIFQKRTFKKLYDTFLKGFTGKATIITNIFIIITFIYSAYLRLYDSFVHAAPAMSDSYLTLEWMKLIIKRTLFIRDDVYPRGFHIVMAVIQKFAYIDPLYVLKYTGPMNGVFITFGIYFVVYRISKRKIAGIIAAIPYGILYQYFIPAWERQAATNSQEFGFIFVLPTIYFFYKYIKENKKSSLITAFCGLASTGLVHLVAVAFECMGIAVIIAAALILDFKKYWKRSSKIVLAGIVCGVLSAAPIGIGMLMGRGLHSSSAEYLTSKVLEISYPTLTKKDYLGLCSIAIIFIYILFHCKNLREQFGNIALALLGSSAFAVYYFGAAVTKNVVVRDRFSDFWALASPVMIGLGVFLLSELLKSIYVKKLFELSLCLAVLAACAVYIKPMPIVPYKMERDAVVEQYHRISSEFNPTMWMEVSMVEGGYSRTLGNGYHMQLDKFLEEYDAKSEKLYSADSSGDSNNSKKSLLSEDIFLFNEKKVFTTQFTDIIDYPKRERENIKLAKWVEEYKKTHDNIFTYYEDNDLIIYRIHYDTTQQENFQQIWGNQ